ncbi:hypothetical protein QY95_01496 [Bacillus thermotolerans]|uniref:Uncharacterized protein n=1 Tax=Bacillus thermotolerans TaxID=1221996 RepID=A0A0F5I4N5_BACTR|nr:hypothetical protein QY95_01496 [Bacillus thermotolerans]
MINVMIGSNVITPDKKRYLDLLNNEAATMTIPPIRNWTM